MLHSVILPADIGISNYTTWRPDQLQFAQKLAKFDVPILGLSCPTGFGKSLTYVAGAILSGKRTVILTSTKILQDQLAADFASVDGVHVLKGRVEYRCVLEDCTCDIALCRWWDEGPTRCPAYHDCPYYTAIRNAPGSKLLITSYAAWIAHSNIAQGIPFARELVICDEAHDIVKAIDSATSVYIPHRVLGRKGKEGERAEDYLRDVTQALAKRVQAARETGEMTPQTVKDKALLQSVVQLSSVQSEIVAETEAYATGTTFYAADIQHLFTRYFRAAKYLVLTSATLSKGSIELLGIPQSECVLLSAQNRIPAANRRVVHVPTIRVRYPMTQAELKYWLHIIDSIVGKYVVQLGYKGIIHSVSYARSREIYTNSSHKNRLLCHDSATDTKYLVEFFRNLSSDVALISPALTTGYDFPYDFCRFQVISKLPFLPPSTLLAWREGKYRGYGFAQTAQTIVQMAGRGCRGPDDWCVTVIVDDHIKWFRKEAAKYWPSWFTVSTVDTVLELPVRQ